MTTLGDLDPATKRRLSRVARCFSPSGRMQRWPSKRSDQELALWVIWSQMPGEGQLSELDVNAMLRTWHDVEDYVLLRRELCELDLFRRTPDGAIYRRVSHEMPQDAETLLELIAAQTA